MAVNPTLRAFLVEGGWKERFDGFVKEDGRKLARKRRVSEMSWDSMEDGGGVLTARVQDLEGDYYEVEISIWEESEGAWEIDATCSCHDTEHVAGQYQDEGFERAGCTA